MTSSIAAIHVAKKQLGMDEDTYRTKLQNIVGKTSTKDMSEAERQSVLQVFRNEGFKPVSKPRPSGRKKLSGQYAGKLQALWIAGWNLGVFRDRDDTALISFVKRQTGLDAVQFLRFSNDAKKAIEALKSILTRDAGVVWPRARIGPDQTGSFGYRIAIAQWKRLSSLGLAAPADFSRAAHEIAGHPPTAPLDERDWIIVMNFLGGRIRGAIGRTPNAMD